MSDQKSGGGHSQQELDIVRGYLDSTKETIQDSCKLIDDAAKQYASMAPGRKPSYIGIMLVMVSVGLELAEAISPSLISFSDIMSTTMLVGGLVLMAAGAGIETLALYLNLKLTSTATEEAQRQLRELERQKTGIFKSFLGG